MNSEGRLVGAGATLVLYKEKGKTDAEEFIVEPLSDVDISELDEWVRARIVKTARDSLDSTLSPAERIETLEVAMRLAQGESMLSAQGARILGTVDGMARLMWQTIRHRHPNLELETLRGYMFDPRNVEAATVLFRELNSEWTEQLKNRKAPTTRGKKNRRPRR